MERDGLITRQRDATDGRVQRIWLTGRARALHEPAIAAAVAENEVALSGLAGAEQHQFIDMMRRVIATLKGRDEGAAG